MSSSAQGTLGSPVGRRIVSLGAGKGGVGSSMISANLGIFLAQIGKRVVLVDANLPDPGLHAWLGVKRPAKTIGDLLRGRSEHIEESVVPTSVTGLYLIAGSPNMFGEESLDIPIQERLLGRIRTLETDFVLVDLPSGLNPLALDMFGQSDLSIAVTAATPDSVEATYRLICAAFIRSLLRAEQSNPRFAESIREMCARGGNLPTPREIVGELRGEPAAKARELSEIFHPQIIVNKTRIKADEELGAAMVSATVRWIGVVPRLLGSVGWDENVWLSLRRALPLLIDFPRSRACKDLERIVRGMLGKEYKDLFSPTLIPPPTERQSLYELLEVYPGASDEEVRRALKQIREWFGADGLAVRGVCGDDERERYQKLAEEAHANLLDKSKRRQYDRTKYPDGVPSSSERQPHDRDSIAGTVAATHDSLPKTELTDDQVVDGTFLGSIRRERNVELIDISNRTKISTGYLRAIEEEKFEDLPAAVFTRGFVTEFARFLKIDSNRAVRDFMSKYEEYNAAGRK